MLGHREIGMKKFGLVFALCIGIFSCSDRPFVTVDGSRLTESDLEKSAPDDYKKIRRQYNQQILESLKNLAIQRMLDLEAKEKGQKTEDYVMGLRMAAQPPSDAEIVELFLGAQENGQIPKNARIEDWKGQIQNYLMQQKGQEAVQNEIARLKQKYEFTVPSVDVQIADEPTRGGATAKVTIVEFTDFECPYCLKAQKASREVRETYGDKIKWVTKDFPLSFHQNAMGAHLAANCVYTQDKAAYWKFYDILFQDDRPNDALTPPSLRGTAQAIGMDMTKFDACLKDPAMQKEIRDDQEQGEELGVSGTPAFFINGRLLSGALPFSEFKNIIDEELK